MVGSCGCRHTPCPSLTAFIPMSRMSGCLAFDLSALWKMPWTCRAGYGTNQRFMLAHPQQLQHQSLDSEGLAPTNKLQ